MPDFVPYAPSDYRKPRRSGQYKRSVRQKLLALVVGVCGLQTLVLLLLLSKFFLVARERARMEVKAGELQTQLSSLQPELARLQAQLDTLVAKRLPGLRRLELDKVIPLDQQYVKSVLFTVTGNTRLRRHEFKLVMRNEDAVALQPRVDVLLFDTLGLQVGQCSAGVFEDGSSILSLLEPGETRSFSGEVEIAEDSKAEYFSVRLK